MARKLGFQMRLYRNAGTFISPSWNEVVNVRDVNPNFTMDEADTSTRESVRNGWNLATPVARSGEIQFDMLYDPADADYVAFKGAYYDGSSIEVAVVDGDILSGSAKGVRMICGVFNLSDAQPLKDAVVVSITLKPTNGDALPSLIGGT